MRRTPLKSNYTETYYDEVDRFLNELRRSPWKDSLGDIPQESKDQIGASGWVEVLDTDGTVIVEINQNGMTWAHAPTHEDGGSDEINIAGLEGISAELAIHLADVTDVHDHGSLSGLSDDDHPQYATNAEFDDHSARHENGGADEISVAGLAGLLADAQTPTAHATSHQDAGTDEIDITGLSGISAELALHLADTADAHDASAISLADAGGNTTETDVEGAIAELYGLVGGGGTLTVEGVAGVDNIDLLAGLQLTNLGSGDIQLRIQYLDDEELLFGTSSDYTIAFNSTSGALDIIGPSAAPTYLWLTSGGGAGDAAGLQVQLDGTSQPSVSLGVDTSGVPSLWFGSGAASLDVQLTRGGANLLELASGDSLEVVAGNITITQGNLELTNANSILTLDTTDISQSAPGTLEIDNATGLSVTGGLLTLGGDVSLLRSAADVLTLNAGDTFVADFINFSSGRVWSMNMSTDHVIAVNSSATTLQYDTAGVNDGGSVIDLANDRFVIPVTGRYRLDFYWATTGSNVPVAGDRTEIRVNGGSIMNCTLHDTAASGSNYFYSAVFAASAGDFVTTAGFTTSQPTSWRGSGSLSLSTQMTLTRLS